MTERRCSITSRHPDPEKTPRALDGLEVCRGHHLKVERMIAELPALYDDLGAALTSSERRDTEQGKRKNSATTAGVSLNENCIEGRREIRSELVRLVRYVTAERGFTMPMDTVPAMATWLTLQVDWLCAQPDAAETHDYLDALSGFRRDAFPSGRRRFIIPGVTCSAPLWCDTTTRAVIRCPGQLVAFLMPDDDRENLSEMVCDTCGMELPLKAAAMPEGRWKAA